MKSHWLRIALAASLAVLGLAACGSGSGSSGGGLTIWEGYTGAASRQRAGPARFEHHGFLQAVQRQNR